MKSKIHIKCVKCGKRTTTANIDVDINNFVCPTCVRDVKEIKKINDVNKVEIIKKSIIRAYEIQVTESELVSLKRLLNMYDTDELWDLKRRIKEIES